MSLSTEMVISAIGWTLLNFIWQGLVIACLCAIVLTLLRNSRPQSRYAIAYIALILCAVIPAIDFCHRIDDLLSAPDTGASLLVLSAADPVAVWLVHLQNLFPWLVGTWLSGVTGMCIRLCLGLAWVHRLRQSGAISAPLKIRVATLAKHIGVKRRIAVRIVGDLDGPVTTGSIRPMIFVPAALVTGMPAELLEALLAHEIAHIRRFDYLFNLFQSAVEALWFFHPAVWWISKRIRTEREQIADDIAAQAIGEPRRLAIALNKLSQIHINTPSFAQMAQGGNLVTRIKRLLRPHNQNLNWKAILPVAGLVATCFVAHANTNSPGTVNASPKSLSETKSIKSLAVAKPQQALARSLPMSSSNVLVVEEDSGKVLLQKNPDDVVPIASLTKLMTAMVVLDAKPDMNEKIAIDRSDIDTLKHSKSRVPVGATLPRKTVLKLALMSSDNRAARSLARTYPGGMTAFSNAVQAKIRKLGLKNTTILEPTGLSPQNTSTAADLLKMADAAGHYPDIANITTDAKETIRVKGREVEYHNTNHFVGKKGWDILLSKTGYTAEAGRCMIMRVKSAGKHVTMVLLNSAADASRAHDIQSIRRLIERNQSHQG